MRMKMMLALLLSCLAAPAGSAINPAEFQHAASEVLQVRQTARIVQDIEVGDERLRRVTLVGVVIAEAQATQPRVGQTVVIDYSVNLTQRERAAQAHAASHGSRPGPQFMYDPDPPQLDAQGAFWAHLAPVAGRLGNVNRHAGAVVDMARENFSGEVFVPVAGQYSFDPPMR